MSVIRILGVGSPHGDDDLGWRAITALEGSDLAARLAPDTLELRRLDRPGALLIEALAEADLVVILDAMSSGSPVGSLRRLDAAEVETLLMPASSHGFDVPSSLALAQALGMVEPPITTVIGIEMGTGSSRDRPHEGPPFAERLLQVVEQEIRRSIAPKPALSTSIHSSA